MHSEEKLPIIKLHGVSDKFAKYLARLNIYSIQDLLFHLPVRYQDRSKIQTIRQLKLGDEALVEGMINRVEFNPRKRSKLLCEIQDGTGSIYLRFFHAMSYQIQKLKRGAQLRCFSEVRLGPKGKEMVHPDFQVMTKDKDKEPDPYFTPIYPATSGMSQYTLRKLNITALTHFDKSDFLPELLPAPILNLFTFPTISESIINIHRPSNHLNKLHLENKQSIFHKRLIFEELLAHRLSLLYLKQLFHSENSWSLKHTSQLTATFLQNLSFQLTEAQIKVKKEIDLDLEKTQPMLRLVQGDVGSGKTVVAALAMLRAVENGYQAALMALTELLAEQHFRTFKNWMTPLNISVVYLSGSVKGSERSKIKKDILNGAAQIVLGTHALFQKEIEFKQLALIVIDEQHRFGVQQRALLREKGRQAACHPHQLILTATPIPRTLAMTLYADLDCSMIDTLPPGRTPIITSIVSSERRNEVLLRVREACMQKAQVYWVCPLIEESEALACQAATLTAQELKKNLRELNVGLIHGRLQSTEKQSVMESFQNGQLNILVATTVIEVGVDVPNASVMVIENAERLGLSQLHQLRGRVGRGHKASYCILLYKHPLSDVQKERLITMRETTDGFKIAQRDLELRGPGEFLGTKQKGDVTFYVADLIRDQECLSQVQKAATIILNQHPESVEPLIKRWLKGEDHYVKV